MARLATRARRPAPLRDAGKTAGDSQDRVTGRKHNLSLVLTEIWKIAVHLKLPLLTPSHVCGRVEIIISMCCSAYAQTDNDVKHVRNNIKWARLKYFKGVYCSPGGGRRWLITTANSHPPSLISHFLITGKHYQPQRRSLTSPLLSLLPPRLLPVPVQTSELEQSGKPSRANDGGVIW